MKKELIAKCCELFEVHPKDLLSDCRLQFLTRPRFALYKALNDRGWSQSQIARYMNRDRSTVTHGIQRAEYFGEKDPVFAERVRILAEMRPEAIELDFIEEESND